MELEQIMKFKNFVVVGDTLNEDKYAYKIKNELKAKGYNVACVGKELKEIDEVMMDIDVLNLCIHPVKGLDLLKKSHKSYKVVLIQPGAESLDIIAYLKKNQIPYLEGCVLVGLRLY